MAVLSLWALLRLAALQSLLQLVLGPAPAASADTWPFAPLVASGRWMKDSRNRTVTYAGTNWPGHGETMVPEGLQHQSIEAIVGRVKSIGMNSIRLTYAIEMVDQIYDNGGSDVDLRTAFTKGLGQANGTAVLAKVLAKNPRFNASSTRLEVFDAIAQECFKNQIYLHLDNHVSKAMWCCGTDDGNAWWGDRFFNTDRWVRGLAYMATHGKNWPALTSMSLRNEPREPTSSTSARSTYNWQSWYGFVRRGADAINAANPVPLIFLSGLSYDTYITPVVQGTALTPGQGRFSRNDFKAPDKLVLEIHNYETGATSCSTLRSTLYKNGFQAMNATDRAAANVMPVLLTEFGFAMDDRTWRGVYATCIAEYLPSIKAGWHIWVLAGNYYVRSGRQDYDENWGLLNRDWSAWRSTGYINGQAVPMVKASLAE